MRTEKAGRGLLLAVWTALVVCAAMPMAWAQGGAGAPTEPPGPAPRVYGSMGAPAEPRVPVRWNRYHDHAAATRLLRALAVRFPKLCRLESLGRSYGRREMWLVTITDRETGSDGQKPAFYIDGGIHANELQGPEVALYTAWYLCEMAQKVSRIGRLLRERAFYIVPILSPDSRDAHMYKPNTTHSPRSGLRPVDEDLDGLVDEDGPDDLDGDGNIVQMRVADPAGRLKPDPKYPQLLVPCDPDEPGQYRLLGWEGIDNDGDGLVNEDGPGGYDPNRDWGWSWQPRSVQHGAYRYPFSIAENRLVAEFVEAHPNIAGAQSYHNAGGMILRGPGSTSDRYEPADVRVMDQIAKRGESMLPGYRYLNVATGLYGVYGGEFDWFYQCRGVLTFTNELFTGFNFFRQTNHGGWYGDPETARRFDRDLLFGQGVVRWHAVDHPVFGQVELGGLKKSWLRQPPSFLLEEECHRNMAFTLYHAEQMPLVRIEAVTVGRLSGGVREVTAEIRNPRLTPTRTAVDRKRGITPPDRTELSGEGVRVLAALVSSDRYFRQPTEDRRSPARVRLDQVPAMGAVYVRWLVTGDGPFTVTVRSAKGGVVTRRVE